VNSIEVRDNEFGIEDEEQDEGGAGRPYLRFGGGTDGGGVGLFE
jgi:hypothetical protein